MLNINLEKLPLARTSSKLLHLYDWGFHSTLVMVHVTLTCRVIIGYLMHQIWIVLCNVFNSLLALWSGHGLVLILHVCIHTYYGVRHALVKSLFSLYKTYLHHN